MRPFDKKEPQWFRVHFVKPGYAFYEVRASDMKDAISKAKSSSPDHWDHVDMTDCEWQIDRVQSIDVDPLLRCSCYRKLK